MLPGIAPGPTLSCRGQQVFSGIVFDAGNDPLAGVQVVFTPAPPLAGGSAVVRTSVGGQWSALVSGGCPYDAAFYRQSAEDGPLIAQRTSIPDRLNLSVPVSSQFRDLALFAEHPDADNVTVMADLGAGVVFTLPAVDSGSIPLGFLPVVAPGQRGANFTLSGELNLTASAPAEVLFLGAAVHSVQDIAGGWVVYAPPQYGGAQLSSTPEDLTPAQGAALAAQQGQDPYYEVCGLCTGGFRMSFTNESGIAVASNPDVFGVSLNASLAAPPRTAVHVTAVFASGGDSNAWFVVYREGADVHAWYGGTGTSPPACAWDVASPCAEAGQRRAMSTRFSKSSQTTSISRKPARRRASRWNSKEGGSPWGCVALLAFCSAKAARREGSCSARAHQRSQPVQRGLPVAP